MRAAKGEMGSCNVDPDSRYLIVSSPQMVMLRFPLRGFPSRFRISISYSRQPIWLVHRDGAQLLGQDPDSYRGRTNETS